MMSRLAHHPRGFVDLFVLEDVDVLCAENLERHGGGHTCRRAGACAFFEGARSKGADDLDESA
jgi:hypothetical protein